MEDAVRRYVRVDVPRVRPNRMRVRSLVDHQAAIVAVETGLNAVRWGEYGRDYLEIVRRVGTRPACEHIVRITGLDARLAWSEPARRRRVLAGHALGPVVAD